MKHTLDRNKVGRPQQIQRPVDGRHPAMRLRELKEELTDAVDYIIGQEGVIFRTHDQREDYTWAVRQAASKLNDLAIAIVNIKAILLAMPAMKDDRFKLL